MVMNRVVNNMFVRILGHPWAFPQINSLYYYYY